MCGCRRPDPKAELPSGQQGQKAPLGGPQPATGLADGAWQPFRAKRPPGHARPHLAEVLGGHAIIIPARKFVDKGQHLVFGTDEFRLGGAACKIKRNG